MLDHVDADDLAATVLMLRGARPSAAIIIVEGADDLAVYGRMLLSQEIVVAGGKRLAVDAIALVEQDKIPGVAAIVDADFDRVTSSLPNSTNILVTDAHDLEVMIVCSGALTRLASKIGSPEKIAKALKQHSHTSLAQLLLHKAAPMGHVRLLSAQGKLNLCFTGIDHERVVDRHSLEADIAKFVRLACDGSNSVTVSFTEVLKLWKRHARVSSRRQLDQITKGDDVVALLAIGFRTILGSRRAEICSPSHIRDILHLTFDLDDLARTDLYARARQWEAQNTPYRLFRHIEAS